MLAEALGRLAWRLRRLRRRHAPAPAASAANGITRYSVFGGRLHVAGTIRADGPVRSVAIEFPGGETFPLTTTPAGLHAVRVDEQIPVPGDPVEAASSTLLCRLEDGRVIPIVSPGAPVDDPAHDLAGQFRRMLGAAPDGTLLEIGARARSGVVRRDWAPEGWRYSGFDIVQGPNVDVVGDAHVLSRHYPAEQFDAVVAFSVLEHLLMPWKFVLELNRVLKPGAVGLFTTHQCWPMHDQPWDFWRFSDTAWSGLLNGATGFEIIAARLGEPAYVVAQRCTPTTAFAERPAAYLASFVLFRKLGPTRLEWPVELQDVLTTAYPKTSPGG